MKLNEKSLINLIDSKDFKNYYLKYNSQKEKYCLSNKEKFIETYGDDRYCSIFKHKDFFYNQKITRRLIFSKKSLSNLNNYKVPKDIRIDVLRTLPNRSDLILLNENNCIRYIKTDNDLYVTFNIIDKHLNCVNVYFFHIDLTDGFVLFDNYDYRKSSMIDFDEMKEEYYNTFMVVITYLELTPVTYDIIDGNRSYGTKKEGKIRNETNKRFIIVNTNWNVETISLMDIHVRGHWRLQPYGVGRSQYKYVFIQPYEKGITRRLPQKELVG